MFHCLQVELLIHYLSLYSTICSVQSTAVLIMPTLSLSLIRMPGTKIIICKMNKWKDMGKKIIYYSFKKERPNMHVCLITRYQGRSLSQDFKGVYLGLKGWGLLEIAPGEDWGMKFLLYKGYLSLCCWHLYFVFLSRPASHCQSGLNGTDSMPSEVGAAAINKWRALQQSRE